MDRIQRPPGWGGGGGVWGVGRSSRFTCHSASHCCIMIVNLNTMINRRVLSKNYPARGTVFGGVLM